MQGKDQGQRTQRLLAPAQIPNVLPALLGRHDREENALAEGVERVDQLQLGVAAQRDQLVHGLEVGGDGVEAGEEAGQAAVAEGGQARLGGVAGGEGGVEVGAAVV